MLNALKTIVDEPGEYLTRDNRKVIIHEVKKGKGLEVTEFLAKGILIWTPNIRVKREYNIWHVSGRCDIFKETPKDIVTKVA